MWLGLALIVWLWGLALYVLAYYAVVLTWTAEELYDLLGQDFYNAHIPLGGWKATLVPTLVFLAVLALVGAARRPLASVADALARRVRVPRRVGLVASYVALVALAVPTLHAGVVAARIGITGAIDRAEREDAEKRVAAENAHRFALDPMAGGKQMGILMTAYSQWRGWGPESFLFDFEGRYVRSARGCVAGSRTEGRFGQEGDVLVLERPPGELPPDPYPPEYPIRLRDIRWGNRRYLLRDSDLQGFCQAINDGRETLLKSSGCFLLRQGDAELEAAGWPTVPEPWNEFLLKAPIEGRVLEGLPDHTLWIDLGSAQGVRKGMQLFLASVPIRPEFQDLWGKAEIPYACEVLEVEAGRSLLGFVQRKQGETILLPIPAGTVVTSLRPPGV